MSGWAIVESGSKWNGSGVNRTSRSHAGELGVAATIVSGHYMKSRTCERETNPHKDGVTNNNAVLMPRTSTKIEVKDQLTEVHVCTLRTALVL